MEKKKTVTFEQDGKPALQHKITRRRTMKLNEDDETVSSCEEICSELDISVLGNEELHKSVSRLKDDLERCIHEVNKNTRLTRQIDDDVTELVDFKDGIHSKLRLYAQE